MTSSHRALSAFAFCAVLTLGVSALGAQPPREHTITVTVVAGSPCTLTTDLAPPNYRLSARPQDTIVLVLAGAPPDSCGVGAGAQLALTDFLQSGKPVSAPVSLVPGQRRAYRVATGRSGLYKFSITLGAIVLDPELEIEA